MQNDIPSLYILKLDSFVVKSAKISTILCLFVQRIKNVDRIAMVTVTRQSEPAFSDDIFPEPTARSAVPGVSPGRGLLIPHGYLHPGKCEHSEV